jgi:hypothetical protein
MIAVLYQYIPQQQVEFSKGKYLGIIYLLGYPLCLNLIDL